MSSAFGLSVKKPVSAWNNPFNANFKDLFKALGKAGFDAAGQNWIGVGKDAVDALTAVGLKGRDPAELSWALIYNSLTNAIFRIVGESQYLMTDIPSDIQQLTDSLDFSFENKDLEINEEFFLHPERLSVVKDMQTPLMQWFEGVGVVSSQAESLSNLLPTYFVRSLHAEWRRHSQDYELIKEKVDTPFTKANNRERGWLLYNAWLQEQTIQPMMFEGFGLSDVYIPLRAYFRRKRTDEEGGEEVLSTRGRED